MDSFLKMYQYSRQNANMSCTDDDNVFANAFREAMEELKEREQEKGKEQDVQAEN